MDRRLFFKGAIDMFKALGIAAIIGAAAFVPATRSAAQHLHFGSGGVGVHFGDDHYDDHWDHHYWGDDDWHHHHYGYDHGGYYHSDFDDAGWLFVVPYFGGRYRGTYYANQDNYYYMPQATGSYRAQPIEIEFGGYAHVDDLSARLERLANELCLDLHYNYRHNPDFKDLYRAAYQIYDTAKFLRDKENQADRDEVARLLDGLDVAFHDVEGAIKGWSRRQNRQIGQGGAQTKLDLVGATLHHLMHDVGVTGAHGVPDTLPGPGTAEVAPPPEPVAEPTPAE